MFEKWRRRRREIRALREQKDAAEIADARSAAEHERVDADLSDVDKAQPIFRPTDWTGGGPT
jgi:hypothetical protein